VFAYRSDATCLMHEITFIMTAPASPERMTALRFINEVRQHTEGGESLARAIQQVRRDYPEGYLIYCLMSDRATTV